MSDLISRQAALDVTTETVFVEYEDDDTRKEESIILQTKAAIRDRIKALPPVYVPDMNVGEMISRRDAIDALNTQAEEMSHWHERYAEQRKGILTAVRIVSDIKPKRGKWIPEYKNPCYNGYYKIPSYCSCCKDYYTKYPEEMNYCPNCGADMRGNEDGTD